MKCSCCVLVSIFKKSAGSSQPIIDIVFSNLNMNLNFYSWQILLKFCKKKNFCHHLYHVDNSHMCTKIKLKTFHARMLLAYM